MTNNFANAGIFLVQTFLGLYLILLLIRFLMQVSRADYYNPICQAVVKLTDPIVKPLRPIIPSFERNDLATTNISSGHSTLQRSNVQSRLKGSICG